MEGCKVSSQKVARLADILDEEVGLAKTGQKRVITGEILARVKKRFAA
jgi:hypothetical protein